jgi:hypothetical protein
LSARANGRSDEGGCPDQPERQRLHESSFERVVDRDPQYK